MKWPILEHSWRWMIRITLARSSSATLLRILFDGVDFLTHSSQRPIPTIMNPKFNTILSSWKAPPCLWYTKDAFPNDNGTPWHILKDQSLIIYQLWDSHIEALSQNPSHVHRTPQIIQANFSTIHKLLGVATHTKAGCSKRLTSVDHNLATTRHNKTWTS